MSRVECYIDLASFPVLQVSMGASRSPPDLHVIQKSLGKGKPGNEDNIDLQMGFKIMFLPTYMSICACAIEIII